VAWSALLLAGAFEILGALSLKYSAGFTKILPTLATGAAMAVSIALLTLSLQSVPLGTAYAVWTGIGAVGTALLGMVIFGEPATVLRLACITLIVVGMAGLKFASPH
jgi:quaternary ammonium compound-resistance protein SugE